MDPMLGFPRPASEGRTEDGLLVLATPPGMSAVRELLRLYFQALTRESPEQLEPLLTEQAVLESSSGRHPARGALRAKFSQLDLAALDGVPLYRERDVQLFRRGESDALLTDRAPELAPGQVFARVPLAVSHSGKTRLLPDRIGFLIQRGPSGYRIATITEELAAP
ncbi:MAG TPA: hypothetical protein VFQ61_36415 [Polyangiaceae bacterium]|nr:hypothetical protein [Polyangiaceae bacterium]